MSDRRIHLNRMSIFTEQAWYVHCIKAGHDSGYSACCIAWFFVRFWMMTIYGVIFGNLGPFKMGKPPKRGTIQYRRQTQHVCCPVHKAIYFLTRKEHHYIMCKDCGWLQYEDPHCKNCAQNNYYGRKSHGNVRHGRSRMPKLQN